MELEKLLKVLAEEGVDEETAKKIVAKLEGEEDLEDDKSKEDKEPENKEDNKEEGSGDGNSSNEEEVPPASEVPPTEEDLPAGTHENPSEEGNPEEVLPPAPPQEEVPPVEEPPVPPQEQVPPSPETVLPPEILDQINGYQTLLDEQAKTIDGLVKRIESLEQALTQSGVISQDETAVGDETQRNIDSGNSHITDDFEDVLGEINRRGSRKF